MQESGSPVLLEHLFRRESGRIVAWLAGLLGSAHLQLAEDAAQEAMLRAAQAWPFQGIPQKPEAWLFRTAHNYAISSVRRGAVFRSKADALVAALETGAQPILDLDVEQSLRDDELRMVFMCCHPKLAPDAQVALSLKLVGGFSTEEIARIFFYEPNAIAQRLVRAKSIICFPQRKAMCWQHLDGWMKQRRRFRRRWSAIAPYRRSAFYSGSWRWCRCNVTLHSPDLGHGQPSVSGNAPLVRRV